MEIKFLQEFDYKDKSSLFGKMDNLNDAIIKEIRDSENSLNITLHGLNNILSPSGEVVYPYKELEIEYIFEKQNYLDIYVHKGKPCIVTIAELLNWVEKKKAEIEMNDWAITSDGIFLLKLIASPKDIRGKFGVTDIDIRLIPKKIIYRWKS